MRKYICYIHPSDPFETPKPVELFEVEALDTKTVDIPPDAIGFKMIEAEKESEALLKMREGQTSSVFLGTKEQIITREMLKEEQDDPFAFPMLMMMEMQGIEMQFQFCIGNYIAFNKGDIVIDPKTREIVYPAPDQSKKLIP